jgi:hypothetical protein
MKKRTWNLVTGDLSFSVLLFSSFFFILFFYLFLDNQTDYIRWALRYIELFKVDFGFCCSVFEFLAVTS